MLGNLESELLEIPNQCLVRPYPKGLPDTPKDPSMQGIKDVWQDLKDTANGDVPLGRCNHSATLVGRGLHSSTSQLNLSRF
jgi:hypothetical protein